MDGVFGLRPKNAPPLRSGAHTCGVLLDRTGYCVGDLEQAMLPEVRERYRCRCSRLVVVGGGFCVDGDVAVVVAVMMVMVMMMMTTFPQPWLKSGSR